MSTEITTTQTSLHTTTSATTQTTQTTLATNELQRPLIAGDADRNGRVEPLDAYLVLCYSSQYSMGNKDYTFTDYPEIEQQLIPKLDIDGDGWITSTDAYWILLYTSYQAMHLEISWNELMGK